MHDPRSVVQQANGVAALTAGADGEQAATASGREAAPPSSASSAPGAEPHASGP